MSSCRNSRYPEPTYLATLSPKGLAHRLTQNCASDSEKVVSIHRWITHHINYDVKRYYSYSVGQKAPSVRKVLRRRKAICSGYSELFATLCQHSGVTAVVVSGYAKGPYFDQNDLFYRADHAWNAVKVKNEWLLTDATWDAGGIRYFRRSLKGHFLHFFTFGKRDHIQYHPRFVRKPIDAFLMRNGAFMKMTHLPEVPLWQLLKPVRTVQEAERDSSFYFRRSINDTTQLNDSLNPMRDFIPKIKPEDRSIDEGHQAFAFNHRNHESEAFAFHLEANNKLRQLDVHSFDSLRFYTDLNLCQKLCKNALLHYDSSLILLGKEKASKLSVLESKEGRLKRENQELIQQTKKVAGVLNTGIKQAAAVKRNSLLYIKNLYRNYYVMSDMDKHNAIPKSHFSRKEDSIRTRKKVENLLDSAKGIQQKLVGLMDASRMKFESVKVKLSDYEYFTRRYSNTTEGLTHLRMQLLDDRSYALRTLKDSLILRKKNSDTQLIVPDKVTITSWSDSVLAVRMLMERLHNLHKLIDQECGTLRRSSRNPNRDISNFLKTTNLSEYYSVLGFVDHFLLESIAMSEQLDEDIKKLFPLNAYETGQYQKEQSMGLYLYDISRVHFKNVYNAGRARSLQKKKQMSQIMSMLKTLAKDFEKFRTGNLKRRRRS